MLRKAVLFGSLLAALGTTSTLAHSSYYKSGFLAGAQVGVGFGSGKFNSTFNINPLLNPNSDSQSGSGRKTSAFFGLLAGYRHIFNQDTTFGLLVELNLPTNTEINKKLVHFPGIDINFENKLKKNYSVIPSVTLGKVFCGRWHASLGLGLAISRFKHQVNLINVTVPASASASVTKVGFVPSLAIEYATTPNVSFFGKIAYEIYGRSNKTLTNTGFGPNTSYRTSVKPNYVTLSLGAAYRF